MSNQSKLITWGSQGSPESEETEFINSVRFFMDKIHESAIKKGHWDDWVDITKSLCWIHSEVSEAFTAWQHGDKPSSKIPEFSTIEEELADVFIIMADACQANRFDLAGAIVAKVAYNTTREYKHGKVN